MNLKFLFLCFFALGLSSITKQATAQSGSGNATYFQPTVFPLAPNSTAFTKFGNYPVNMYSGLPDISIPLYSIEAGGLKVPITLSYHGSGNKIADVASWVGLGWSVNCGGSVTRVINGLQDDNGYLKGDMKKPGTLHPETNNDDIDYLRETVEEQAWDTMPDIFSYQVPGYSGKFFFDGANNYKIENIPYSGTKISALTATDTISGFNIWDDRGNYFGLGRTYREKTAFNHGTAISAWMLETMISQNKRDTVNFSYTPAGLLTYPDGLTETISVEDYYTAYNENNAGYINATEPQVSLLNNPSTVIEEQMQSITFKNGRVDFVLSKQPRTDIGNGSQFIKSLDTIKVSAYNFATRKMEVQKSVVFYKSYFNQSAPGAQRLRLDSIQVLDKAGSVVQHYRFTYNTLINLPAYGSLARDLWGYYNGKNGNTDLVPTTTIRYYHDNGLTYSNMTIGSTDSTSRYCDTNYMQANILNRIDYPTGGYTTFSWQTNRYADSAHISHLAGGLRIYQISNYDNALSTTPTLVKTYQYGAGRSNFITNGNNAIANGFFYNSQTYRNWLTVYNTDGTFPIGYDLGDTKRVRRYYSQPQMDLAPDAMPVTYARVTEYDGTPAANAGKTIYTFSDSPSDDFQTATYTHIPTYYSFFFSRGQLLDKKSYMAKSGGGYQVVSDDSSFYAAFPVRYYDGTGLAIGQNNYNDGSLLGGSAYPGQESPDDYSSLSYPFNWYDIVSGDNVLVGKISRVYDINDTTKYVRTTATYTYDDTTHMQMTAAAHTDSRGNTRTESSKYPYAYATGNAVIDTMVNDNMLAETIEKTETYTTGSGTKTTAAQLNTFKAGSLGSVVPATVSTLSMAQPLTDFTPSSVVSGSLHSDSRYTQMISFDSYDGQSNLAQYTTRNATPTAILWNYNYELPVAQVKNAAWSSAYPPVLYDGFETAKSNGWSYSGTPAADLTAPGGAMVYPLGAGSVTNSAALPSGTAYTLSYWGKGGAATVYAGSTLTGTALNTVNGWTYYEYTVPSGVTTVTISGTVSIDELRLYPVNAQMTTYNYDPSGLRSIADMKGANTYFDYDFFERMKDAKDWAGNIVKSFSYHTYDQIFGNNAQTASISRNNCPAGTAPGALSYTVPANKYYAPTQAAADAEAIYDLNINGQAKANANCACTVIMVSVQVNNNTGLASYPITFAGQPTYYVPAGTSNISVPENVSYSTCQVGPLGSGTYNFTMGTRPAQNGVHYATFNSVNIAPGSSDLTITIAP